MTAEQKLKYLADYMDMWVVLRIAQLTRVEKTIELLWTHHVYCNFGEVPIPKFEYYLNWIKKNELNEKCF